MTATKFQCPNGTIVPIPVCLNACVNSQRCMFQPTLRAVAKTTERNLPEPTVTELLCGIRETYLKKTTEYVQLIPCSSFLPFMVVQFILLTKVIPRVICLVKSVLLMK